VNKAIPDEIDGRAGLDEGQQELKVDELTRTAAEVNVALHRIRHKLLDVTENTAWWAGVVQQLFDTLWVVLDCRRVGWERNVDLKLLADGLDEAANTGAKRVYSAEERVVWCPSK
jgi:hypothetical protein